MQLNVLRQNILTVWYTKVLWCTKYYLFFLPHLINQQKDAYISLVQLKSILKVLLLFILAG